MSTTLSYIAFLRAINVGGHTITMQALRDHFSEMGMTNVRTYIQTGNVFFETEEADRLKLQEKIEKHLSHVLGYEVPTCLRTVEELETALKVSPFQGKEPLLDDRFLVVFAATFLPKNLILPLVSPKGDYEVVGATATDAFVIMHLQNGRPGNPIFLEKMLGIKATSRFYHTSVKILEAAQNKK